MLLWVWYTEGFILFLKKYTRVFDEDIPASVLQEQVKQPPPTSSTLVIPLEGTSVWTYHYNPRNSETCHWYKVWKVKTLPHAWWSTSFSGSDLQMVSLLYRETQTGLSPGPFQQLVSTRLFPLKESMLSLFQFQLWMRLGETKDDSLYWHLGVSLQCNCSRSSTVSTTFDVPCRKEAEWKMSSGACGKSSIVFFLFCFVLWRRDESQASFKTAKYNPKS